MTTRPTFPMCFYQDRESFNDHSFNIDENLLNTPPCFDALYGNEENSSECREVIFYYYLEIEDVDLYYYPLNPHVSSQTLFENEKTPI